MTTDAAAPVDDGLEHRPAHLPDCPRCGHPVMLVVNTDGATVPVDPDDSDDGPIVDLDGDAHWPHRCP